MQTVRRLYLYLMSGIALGVLLVGLNITVWRCAAIRHCGPRLHRRRPVLQQPARSRQPPRRTDGCWC
jgi:hypothetical protein